VRYGTVVAIFLAVYLKTSGEIILIGSETFTLSKSISKCPELNSDTRRFL
jgi:hypothetical protein